MKNSEKNLMVLENFILHVTHTNEGDSDANQAFLTTPNELYQMARDYIKEDHVDGEGNPEDNQDAIKDEVASTAAYIVRQDLLNGTFFQTYDEAKKVAKEFVEKYPPETKWGENNLEWDETIEKFVNQRYTNGKRH